MMTVPRVESKPMLLLLSFLVTLLMWISLSGRFRSPENQSARVFPQIPVLHQNIPKNIDLKSSIVLARITLAGTLRELEAIDPNTDLRVELDVGGLGPGTYSLSMTADNVRIPRRLSSLSVRDIEPKTVEFTLIPRSSKTVPLVMEIVGKPAPNHDVRKIELIPPQVTLTGPMAELAKYEELKVEPIDIEGATSAIIEGSGRFDFSNQVDPSVVISGITSLHYRIEIGEKTISKRFRRSFPITVDKSSGYTIQPARASLIIHGPMSVVEWFESDWVEPEVLVMEFIESPPGAKGPPAPAPPATPRYRKEKAYSVPITEGWALPQVVKEAFPDWAERIGSLQLEWVPAKVEVIKP